MKSSIAALVTASLFTLAADAWAFNRNLTGVWTHSGTEWVIAHVGDSASFSTSEYVQEIGLMTLSFNGSVSPGDEDDEFEYDGTMEPVRFRIGGRRCTMGGQMSNAGYMTGDVGGRVIHMERCTVTVTIRCDGSDRRMRERLTCAGVWR